MKPFVPYLRVVAGFFAAVCTWVVILSLFTGDFGAAGVGVVMTAGLWYLAVGKPIREHLARQKAESDALAARAQAGHEAFMAGDSSAFAPPPPAPEKRPVRRGVLIASAVAALFVVIGIVGDISDGLDAESDTETTTTAPATPASKAATPAPQAPPVAQAAAAPTTAPLAAAAPAEPAVMPYVTCMNLQDAQDAIQVAGVFYSRSQDATGKGRNQVLDGNWVVVGQTPAAGAAVAEGEAVLSVVKIGEPGDCS